MLHVPPFKSLPLSPSLPPPPPPSGSDNWTAAERRQFNKGIAAYKKDFFMVQKQVRCGLGRKNRQMKKKKWLWEG